MKILSYPIIILLLVLTVMEIIPVVSWGVANYLTYKWMLIGMVAYFLLRLVLFRRNEKWMQTFAHELSHTIVGLFFFRKIHSFLAEEGTGVIYHSGRRHFGDIFISLAPYCLPYFTYIFLLLRIVGADNMLYIFDILVGFSLAFHLGCFISQTRSYQTDIQQHGYLRSYLFIATALIFNFTVILLSIRFGILKAFGDLFPQYWADLQAIWAQIKLLPTLIGK